MGEIEKTCENCEYECEDMEGPHCRHCIHNAEEHFNPKRKTEREKAIDECIKIIEETCWCDADMLVENIREFTKEGGKERTDTYVITLYGCDDITEFEMELSEIQYQFLLSVSDKSKEVSTYVCMPTLEVVKKEWGK